MLIKVFCDTIILMLKEEMKKIIDEYKEKCCSLNIYISEMKNCDKIVNNSRISVDKNNLKELFIICDEIDGEPYIVKCPVVENGKFTYIVNIKDRKNVSHTNSLKFINPEKYKVKKNIIDCDSNISSSYEIALFRLLQREKYFILQKVKDTNDLEIYNLVMSALQESINFGLEFAARYLNIDYIFRLEDDTKKILNKKNSDLKK